MDRPIDIIQVLHVPRCGLIVTFSDGTAASYPSEELGALRPYRESTSPAAPRPAGPAHRRCRLRSRP